jgi:hypothetical protein
MNFHGPFEDQHEQIVDLRIIARVAWLANEERSLPLSGRLSGTSNCGGM